VSDDFVFILGEPGGLRKESWEVFTARGRVEDCACGMIQCVCVEARKHDERCLYRKSLLCALAFPCEKHGLDECLDCDCDCMYKTRELSHDETKE